jgi:hypothetical protein
MTKLNHFNKLNRDVLLSSTAVTNGGSGVAYQRTLGGFATSRNSTKPYDLQGQQDSVLQELIKESVHKNLVD